MRGATITGAALAGVVCAGPAAAQQVSEVVVTAAPYAISLDSATTNVDVVGRKDLDRAPASGLGDVLAGLPGVRSSFFGPGASRPVIRGLAGPRVMVLANGMGLIDASALSPDHQVASDPQEAERIEVLRGPSALAYGGSAIGGIVNVIDDRIPEKVVEGLEGRVLAGVSSVDDGRAVSGALRAGAGRLIFTLDGVHRRSDDYEAPTGRVADSAVALDAYGAGFSFVGDHGFAGLALKRTESTYGVPVPEDEPISIRLRQTRADARGAWNFTSGPFERIKAAAGWADYEHAEREGGAVGTRFLSEGWEARLELVQRDRNGWQGAAGFQALSRTLDAIGEEALIPSTAIREQGVFTLQRLDKDLWGIEGGLRLDRRELESPTAGRRFTNVSASAAAFLRPSDRWFLSLSVSRTSRAPTEEELFANGPHPATNAFEVGDVTLKREVSDSVDATVHYAGGSWSMDLHAFAARYRGFIDLLPTGVDDPESGLAIFAYRQIGARFHGAEAEGSYRLWEEGARSLKLEASADVVRGETDAGPAPRMPPWSAALRLAGEGARWSAHLEVRRVGAQNRLASFETPTDDYTLVNASLAVRPFGETGVQVFLAARNIGDVLAREHASFLKAFAPLPGRNVRLGLGYRF